MAGLPPSKSNAVQQFQLGDFIVGRYALDLARGAHSLTAIAESAPYSTLAQVPGLQSTGERENGRVSVFSRSPVLL
ncbi:MAG: hypothetical protein KAX36_07775, partial [Thermoflexales bacterium]|nr:hypothetical protein [Thermoflexales bacterium]